MILLKSIGLRCTLDLMNKVTTYTYENMNISLNIIGKIKALEKLCINCNKVSIFKIQYCFLTYILLHLPLIRAANIDHGHWTAPYFDCDGLVKMWKITYASPFFGWDSLRQRIEFKYVLLLNSIL